MFDLFPSYLRMYVFAYCFCYNTRRRCAGIPDARWDEVLGCMGGGLCRRMELVCQCAALPLDKDAKTEEDRQELYFRHLVFFFFLAASPRPIPHYKRQTARGLAGSLSCDNPATGIYKYHVLAY